MNKDARLPFASRWELKEARSSRWSCAGDWSGCRWRRAGCGRCAHRLSPHGRTALRRVAYRSAHLRWRHSCTYHCRACRQLHPGAARHAPRSNHYTPLRLTSRHCSRVVFTSCGHPNYCAQRAHLVFGRWRLRSLIIPKSSLDWIVTPPLAGIEGLDRVAFLAYDSLGSLLSSAVCWPSLCFRN